MNNDDDQSSEIDQNIPDDPDRPIESESPLFDSPRPTSVQAQPDILQSFTRLILGGALEGWDQLTSRIIEWEKEAGSTRATLPDERSLIIIDNDSPEPESEQRGAGQTTPVESQSKVIGLALAGLLFKGQSRMTRRRRQVSKAANLAASAALEPVASWAGRQKRLQPARNRFDDLVQRGQMISRDWIDRGRLEEARSRQLVRTAAKDSFSDTMDELGQAPALQDLVKKQSASLTQDALDEARIRTVSGDYVLEHFLRSLLRRMPRSQLPTPASAEDGLDSSEEGAD